MKNEESSRYEGQRLALLGAFPFPYPQGSQVFAGDQARALALSGARPELFTYGRGQGKPPPDLKTHVSRSWSAPPSMRSGPHWRKPLADLDLAWVWKNQAAQARREGDPFDCLLAHNVEAAAVGIALRSTTDVPVVYVAHTILRHELSAYLPKRLRPVADRIGQAMDRWVSARCDGIIALSMDAAKELEPFSNGPISIQPPGHFIQPPPSEDQIAASCKKHGLTIGRYVLYSGNLDEYQDLELLEEACLKLSSSMPPIVIACHAPQTEKGIRKNPFPSVPCLHIEDFNEMRNLMYGAESLILTRRRPGGFPIKLLNYMEAARPIIAFEGIASGLLNGESARLLPPGSSSLEFAKAITEVHNQPQLQERLGSGAFRHLTQEHDWRALGENTVSYINEITEMK